MRRIIEAARAGKTLLEVPVFDGSETGEKVYDTLTVIGQPIEPEQEARRRRGRDEQLPKLTRWPVSISYFDKPKRGRRADADLCDRLRALRERHLARAVARLRRLRRRRRDDLARGQAAPSPASRRPARQRSSSPFEARPLTTAVRPNLSRRRSTARSAGRALARRRIEQIGRIGLLCRRCRFETPIPIRR